MKMRIFTKYLAILQVLWLMVTILIRASSHSIITQLEVFAVAFVICSALTYSFWWNKPQDVRTAEEIRGYCSHCADTTEMYYDSLFIELRNVEPDRILKEIIGPLGRI